MTLRIRYDEKKMMAPPPPAEERTRGVSAEALDSHTHPDPHADSDRDSEPNYLSRLALLVPVEATTLYLALNGLADTVTENPPMYLFILFIAGLVTSVIVKAVGTVDPETNDFQPDWMHVMVSAIAFVFWAYAINNPLEMIGVQTNPFLALLTTALFTTLLPSVHKLLRVFEVRQRQRRQPVG